LLGLGLGVALCGGDRVGVLFSGGLFVVVGFWVLVVFLFGLLSSVFFVWVVVVGGVFVFGLSSGDFRWFFCVGGLCFFFYVVVDG